MLRFLSMLPQMKVRKWVLITAQFNPHTISIIMQICMKSPSFNSFIQVPEEKNNQKKHHR